MTAQIRFEGPYETGSPSAGFVELYVGQDSGYEATTEANEKDIPGQDDSESILAPLQGTRSFRFQGEAVKERLVREGYGGTARDALIEWIYEAESLCMSEQGEGYRVIDNSRGFDRAPGSGGGFMVEEFEWTHDVERPYDVEWRVEIKRVEGVQPAGNRSGYISDQVGERDPSITEDEIEANGTTLPLGEVSSRAYERSIDLNDMSMMHQFDVEAYGLVESGVQGEYTLQGRLTVADAGSLAGLRQLSILINEDLHGASATLYDALTQRPVEGAVTDSKTSWEAGSNILNYDLTFKVGDVVL